MLRLIFYCLNHKCSFDIVSIVRSMVFNFMMPIATEMIEAEAVGFWFDNGEEFGLEGD